MILINLNKIY